jgi:hypothetical protein
MTPWIARPTLDIDLNRSVTDVAIPGEALAASRRLLASVKEQIPPSARVLAQLARLRTGNRFHREIVAMARLAEVDWRDLMLANLSYDLVLAWLGCSTIALPTADGPVLARNMDWWPEDLLARASYLLRYRHNGNLSFASAGWPGAVGIVTGMSARGFAVALNAVSCPEKWRRTGYPVLLHLRRVVEDAPSFDHALKMLAEQRLTSPALFTLVGRENNERVVIERSPTCHALRRVRDNEPLFATNDYRVLFQGGAGAALPREGPGAEFFETTCRRYDTLCRFFADWSPGKKIGDEQLLYVLSDPGVVQSITAQHIVMRPRPGEARLFVPRRLVQDSGS